MEKSIEEIVKEIIAEMKLEEKNLHLSPEDIEKLYEYLTNNNKYYYKNIDNKFKGKK